MKHWTSENIGILRKGYFTLGARALARKLGIPSTTIRRKAEELGLRKNPKFLAKSPFTKSMDKMLRALYCGRGSAWKTSEIAQEMGLSPQQVERRIRALGLIRGDNARLPRSGKHWTEKEIQFLRAHFKKMPWCELQDKLQRPIDGIQKKAEKLGLTEKRQPKPKEKPLKKHHPEPDGSIIPF